MATNTNINIPQSPFLDGLTGRPAREWMLWLMSPSIIQLTTANALGVTSGGTGLTTIPTNGQFLIGNGTGYTLNTLGYGAGISVTNGSGTITVANTGVLSNIAGTGISVSSATGNVTVSNTGVLTFSGGSTGLTPATATNGAITLAGTLAIASGGTNGSASPTAGAIAYGTGTAYGFTLAGTTNQALLSTGAGTPTWNTLTSGSSILYGNGSGLFSNVTIGSGVSFAGGVLSATGTGGTVTSVTATTPLASSGGTTPNLTIQQSSASQAGYLSAADWSTFNGKQPAGTYVNSVTGTSPVVSSGGVNPAISMPAATTLVNGYLTSTDWNTFNNKQPAGTYVNSVSGTSGRITSTGGVTPVIDLASGIATPGTTGSSTLVPVITIDTYGRVTSITTAANPQGTVTSVSGTGTVNGITLTGTVTSSGSLTLGGTLGGIGNSQLTNSSITINGSAISLGGSVSVGTVTSVTGTAPVVSSGGTTPAISMAAATTSTNGYLTSTDWNTFNGKQPAGTYVTSVSVVSANGFAGTVTTGATPAITLTTTITGLLKGNGTAISAAVANTDYVPLSTVLTVTADYTITGTDTWIINNKTSSALTLTFPAASSWTGRSITVKNLQTQLVNSASSNIVPIGSATAGTAILLNVVGNWATMVSDGTNWVIMQAASNNNLLLE